MNYQCPRCFTVHEAGSDDSRRPPWCSKCGADVKPNEWHPVHLPTPAVETAPSMFDGEAEITTVTSTGPRPWLNRPAAKPTPAPPPPPAAPREATAPAAAPLSVAAKAETSTLGLLLLAMSVIAVGLLAAAVYLTVQVRNFVKTGHETPGKVVRVWKFQTDTVMFGQHLKEPVIEYEVNKKKYELPPGLWNEGEQVTIVYPPASPKDGRVNTTLSLYMWPLLCGSLGLVLLLGSLAGSQLLPDPDEPGAKPAAKWGDEW